CQCYFWILLHFPKDLNGIIGPKNIVRADQRHIFRLTLKNRNFEILKSADVFRMADMGDLRVTLRQIGAQFAGAVGRAVIVKNDFSCLADAGFYGSYNVTCFIIDRNCNGQFLKERIHVRLRKSRVTEWLRQILPPIRGRRKAGWQFLRGYSTERSRYNPVLYRAGDSERQQEYGCREAAILVYAATNRIHNRGVPP